MEAAGEAEAEALEAAADEADGPERPLDGRCYSQMSLEITRMMFKTSDLRMI